MNKGNSMVQDKVNTEGTKVFSQRPALTSNVMMVRPANFGFNDETAENNAFQINNTEISTAEIAAKAVQEFDRFVTMLKKNDVNVEVIQDPQFPVNPDAVFPNNWISFHHPDFVVTYPMFALKRRNERRKEIIDDLKLAYSIKAQFEFEHFEKEKMFLEGTGSIVFDRTHKIAYACKSIRTNEYLFNKFCEDLHFTPILFDAVDKKGQPIYHTNVMMTVGVDFVIICMESIASVVDRKKLEALFKETGKAIIPISIPQMEQFAGNMIQLKNKNEESLLVMSSKAFNSLTQVQLIEMENYAKIIHADLDVIETYGGGGARCMIAEIFLKPLHGK
ncbi:citrulline utilization hydrolase CtlX [Aquimarina agarilytica]|uniref:citrulline utilization hydrolase CtlX n=1 Tax=Aquimarina agarilytica TaxID=1087449 RepID=UPI0002891602|nr:arginine deiminase-related protein [Aquimarina agarilytica]